MNRAKYKEGDLVIYTFIGDPIEYKGFIQSVEFRTHTAAWFYTIVDVRHDRIHPVNRRENMVSLVREFDLSGLLAI